MNEASKDMDARRQEARRRRREAGEISKRRRKTDRVDWKGKDSGTVTVLIHPESEMYRRWRHWLPTLIEKEETTKDGRKRRVKRWVRVPFNCPKDPETKEGCPACDLVERLKADDSVEMDSVILRYGTGRDVQEYTKADIIGDESGDWRRRVKSQPDFIGCVVVAQDASGKQPDNVRPQVLEDKLTCHQAIMDCIESEEAELGEDEGNPWLNPYAIRLKYDRSKPTQSRFDARVVARYKITDEVQAALDADPCDLAEEVSTTGVAEKLEKILATGNVVDVEEAAPQTVPDGRKSRKELADEKKGRRVADEAAEEAVEDVTEPDQEPSEDTFDCPHCAGQMPVTTDKCPHCGADLSEDEPF